MPALANPSTPSRATPPGRFVLGAFVAATMVGMTFIPADAGADDRASTAGEPVAGAGHQILPAPASFTPVPGETFELTESSHIVVPAEDPEARAVAERFATWLRRSTGFGLPVGAGNGAADITLVLDGSEQLGAEGYALRADSSGVRIGATTAEGLFRGLTTLRQMLPAASESADVRPGPWTVAGADITDQPRFEYRGVMLDVARHFFPVEDVLRFIDLISLYKINVLHLHLTDDQGWRLTVPGWPRLTEIGGATDIDGGAGGVYTEEDYARIVDYAAEHYIEVVPEIDVPGHTTAALLAYPELSCDGTAPPPNTQPGPGDVSLCVGKPETLEFMAGVYDTAAAQPGTFLHIGGDEAIATTHEDFLDFVPKAAQLVTDRQRRVIAWHEAAQASLPAGSVVQYWGIGQRDATELARQAAARGHQILLSPANHAYLDMKYDDATPCGLTWAGNVPVSTSYDWEPATLIEGVPEDSIIGVEAPLWSETVADRDALDLMVFPRLAGIAEIGWSPASTLAWEHFRIRLAAQGPRWDLLGINYFRSPEVPWASS